jgi:hypothetical protein
MNSFGASVPSNASTQEYAMLKPFLGLVTMCLAFSAVPSIAQTSGGATMPTTAPHKMVSIIQVTDYAKWLAGFNTFETQRAAGGLHNPKILRGVTDTNTVAIIFDVDDVTKARAFMTSSALRTATDSSGVVGPPVIFFP